MVPFVEFVFCFKSLAIVDPEKLISDFVDNYTQHSNGESRTLVRFAWYLHLYIDIEDVTLTRFSVHIKFGVQEIERFFVPTARSRGNSRLWFPGFVAMFRLRCHESDFLPGGGKLGFFDPLDGVA